MIITLKLPREICNNQAGYEALLRIWHETKNCSADDIEIDMSGTRWFEANMCAVLGALLYRLGDRLNAVRLINMQRQVEKALSQNAFLTHYGSEPLLDEWGTTITYQRFETKDERYFANYIDNELMQRRQIPVMSLELKKKFTESIFEIFSNATFHSGTELGIFSCGQYHPKNHLLKFSVTDLGIGIRENIKKVRRFDFTPERAIQWATQDGNTTRMGSVSGGLGLKLLRDFIDLNGGSIQIISDAGYWERKERHTNVARLRRSFPGTVVSIEIKTNDTQSYALASELRPSDIF